MVCGALLAYANTTGGCREGGSTGSAANGAFARHGFPVGATGSPAIEESSKIREAGRFPIVLNQFKKPQRMPTNTKGDEMANAGHECLRHLGPPL